MATKKTSTKATSNPKPEPAEVRSGKAHHLITQLEVESGFLDGVKLELVPGLNCLIGERGTGKTTVLEFLRFALKPESDSKKLKSLIKENLGSGLVRVGLTTKEGLRLTVERQGGAAAAEVLNDKGCPRDTASSTASSSTATSTGRTRSRPSPARASGSSS